MDDFSNAIIPASTSSEPYLELDSGDPGPARFRKHILTLGDLHYGGKTYRLGEEFWRQLDRNFRDGVSLVQVPLADANNKHTEDPMRNAGEVVGLERDGDKVFTVLDIRDPEVAQRIRDRRIMGASAMLSLDYQDSRTGKRVGPALLHHCITNRPHVVGLDDYEEVVAATAGFESPVVLGYPDEDAEPVTLADEPAPEPVVLADDPAGGPEPDAPGLLLTALGEVLGLAAEDIQDEVRAALCLTGGESPERVAASVVMLAAERDELGEKAVKLAAMNDELAADLAAEKRERAEVVVDACVGEGRLFAKTRDLAVNVYLSDGQDGLDALLSPASEPLIELNRQAGITGEGDTAMQQQYDIDQEIRRLGEIANRSKDAR